jgi:cell division inhibitor SulA/protein ImuA
VSTPDPNPLPPALLAHPGLWRARDHASAARSNDTGSLPTGHAELDARLPGGGWPRRGLVEILTDRQGIGELSLLLPALVALCRAEGEAGGWLAWIAPPYAPYAPALAARGIDLRRVLVVRASNPEWAIEQSLASGACSAVLGWTGRGVVRRAAASGPASGPASGLDRHLRRLQLAAEQSGTLAVLFRPLAAAASASPAVLRLAVGLPAPGATPAPAGAHWLEVRILKSRGGPPASLRLELPSPDTDIDIDTGADADPLAR